MLPVIFLWIFVWSYCWKNLSQYISKYLVKQQTRESDVYSKITRFNAVNVMSGLVLLCATWICCINYRNGYVGLIALHLAHFLRVLLCALVHIHLNWQKFWLFLMFLVGSFVGVVGCSFFCQHSCFFPRIARWWNYVLAECFAFLWVTTWMTLRPVFHSLFLFLVTPYTIAAVQPCMEWILNPK